jgi:hypothetical protein
LALATVLLLAGCAGDNGVSFRAPQGVDPSDAGTAGGDDGASSRRTYTVSTGPITLGPGEERVVCVDRRIPSDRATDIVRISSDLTEGGHHLVFYRSTATEETDAPFACETFRGILNGLVPLYIAQKAETELLFPAGVAYALPAAQMVRIELHFLNAKSQPLAVTGTVHLGEATPGTVVDHANLMFYGNLNIRIPPLSAATVGPTFRPFRATSPRLFGLTGHQHKRGTGVTIDLASSVSGPSTRLYVNHDWADPPLAIFDPPIATAPGQGFRYTCTYDNPTSQPVSFGEGVNQEMCFLWSYYYPDMGLELGLDW